MPPPLTHTDVQRYHFLYLSSNESMRVCMCMFVSVRIQSVRPCVYRQGLVQDLEPM